MGRLWRALLPSLIVGSSVCAAARARASDPPQEPYFYHGYEYGTQSLYNPMWVIMNRGFDVLQMHVDSRNLSGITYGPDARNIANNLFVHPISSVSEEGWGKFLREEVFPLSFTRTSARWPPNYSLHLLGGGMTFTALREWHHAHGVGKVPAYILSAGTVLASAFINETLENSGVQGRNTDAIADFYFFDVGGIIVFSFDWPNRFFSKTVMIADWSLQPSFTFPSGELHNQGNYFSAKWALPFYNPLRLFTYFGMGTLFGLSYKFEGEYSISAGGGYKVTRLINTASSDEILANNVEFAPSGGLFIDRNNSLLGSVQVSNVKDYFVQFNLYPNAILRTDPGFGFWSVVGYGTGFAFGISVTRALGLGVGASSL